MFYSGFYLPLHWSARSILTNSADIIRAEAVHGYCLGYKFQRGYRNAAPTRQQQLRNSAYPMLNEL